jgi:uncharacterized protein YlxP (DUF503 family)
MSDAAERINALHKELKQDNNASLKKSIELGETLNVAYNKFVAEKSESKMTDTWKNWILGFTTISESYSRQLRKMADLVGKYPKLKQLGLNYTDVFKLQAKIKSVFAIDVSIAKQWQ